MRQTNKAPLTWLQGKIQWWLSNVPKNEKSLHKSAYFSPVMQTLHLMLGDKRNAIIPAQAQEQWTW